MSGTFKVHPSTPGGKVLIQDVQAKLADLLGVEELADTSLSEFLAILVAKESDRAVVEKELAELVDDLAPTLLEWVYEQLTAQPKRYFLHEGGGDEQEEELEEELPLEEEDYEEEDLTQQQQEQQQEQEQQEAQQAEAAAAPSAEQEAKRAGSRQHSAIVFDAPAPAAAEPAAERGGEQASTSQPGQDSSRPAARAAAPPRSRIEVNAVTRLRSALVQPDRPPSAGKRRARDSDGDAGGEPAARREREQEEEAPRRRRPAMRPGGLGGFSAMFKKALTEVEKSSKEVVKVKKTPEEVMALMAQARKRKLQTEARDGAKAPLAAAAAKKRPLAQQAGGAAAAPAAKRRVEGGSAAQKPVAVVGLKSAAAKQQEQQQQQQQQQQPKVRVFERLGAPTLRAAAASAAQPAAAAAAPSKQPPAAAAAPADKAAAANAAAQLSVFNRLGGLQFKQPAAAWERPAAAAPFGRAPTTIDAQASASNPPAQQEQQRPAKAARTAAAASAPAAARAKAAGANTAAAPAAPKVLRGAATAAGSAPKAKAAAPRAAPAAAAAAAPAAGRARAAAGGKPAAAKPAGAAGGAAKPKGMDAATLAEKEALKAKLQALAQEVSRLRATQQQGGGAAAGQQVDERSVVVKNVHPRATQQVLSAYFNGCGAIKRVTLVPAGFGGTTHAFMEFGSADAASKALGLSGTRLVGMALTVEPKVSRLPPGFQHQGGLKGATRGGSAVKGGAVAASGNDSDQELLV